LQNRLLTQSPVTLCRHLRVGRQSFAFGMPDTEEGRSKRRSRLVPMRSGFRFTYWSLESTPGLWADRRLFSHSRGRRGQLPDTSSILERSHTRSLQCRRIDPKNRRTCKPGGKPLPDYDPVISADSSGADGVPKRSTIARLKAGLRAGEHPAAENQQRRGKNSRATLVPAVEWCAAKRRSGCEARDLRDSSLSAESRAANACASRTCGTAGTRCCCRGRCRDV
jgi:hypothetical protein